MKTVKKDEFDLRASLFFYGECILSEANVFSPFKRAEILFTVQLSLLFILK